MSKEVGLNAESDAELDQVSGGVRHESTITCRYCLKRFRKDMYYTHVQICRSNPNRKTLKELLEEKKAEGQ